MLAAASDSSEAAAGAAAAMMRPAAPPGTPPGVCVCLFVCMSECGTRTHRYTCIHTHLFKHPHTQTHTTQANAPACSAPLLRPAAAAHPPPASKPPPLTPTQTSEWHPAQMAKPLLQQQPAIPTPTFDQQAARQQLILMRIYAQQAARTVPVVPVWQGEVFLQVGVVVL